MKLLKNEYRKFKVFNHTSFYSFGYNKKMSLVKKIFNRLFPKFQRSADTFKILAPYAYVQKITEKNLNLYLGLEKEDIKNWIIVGGYVGEEIPNIIKNYSNSKITIFECSKRYIETLRKKFKANSRIKIITKAVSDKSGFANFFETNKVGSGSLLTVGELAKKSYGMKQAESFLVETITLDEILDDVDIDMLQIDVQGAELKVLNGANNIIKKTKSIFLEISILPSLYVGSAQFKEIDDKLKSHGFLLILLGTDVNFTGNALYVNLNLMKK